VSTGGRDVRSNRFTAFACRGLPPSSSGASCYVIGTWHRQARRSLAAGEIRAPGTSLCTTNTGHEGGRISYNFSSTGEPECMIRKGK
jgi:hypothetical protein